MEMPKKYFQFRPAELRKLKDRWQIVFYATDPATGLMVLHRETHNLNRIKDLREREKHALRIIAHLNRDLLPHGYPYRSEQEITAPPEPVKPRMVDEFRRALDLKCRSDKEETVRTYKGIGSVFFKFVAAQKLEKLPVDGFTKKYVQAFSDWLRVEREVNNRTHNKYMGHLRAIWAELEKREVVAVNPFTKPPNLKEAPASIRTFTPTERAAVADYIRRTDTWLLYFVLLEYYAKIRGRELRRLRFRDVNLTEGYVFLDASKTKNGKPRYATIPKIAMPHFLAEDFTKWPANYLIFGEHFKPHPKKPVGPNTPNSRHRAVLEKLKADGVLEYIENLSMYSWKHTGITEDLDGGEVNLTDVQGQSDHSNPLQTMTYYHREKVNPRYREMKRGIFDAK